MGDTKVEILEATRTVLAERGFHGLTTERVAAEIGASHSLVHYHFDTKADLVAAFLDYYREEFGRLLDGLADLPPGERLATVLAVMASGAGEESVRDLNLAVYELQAHAARHDAYQESLTDYGEFVEGFFLDCVTEGVEQGVFRDVDPEATAGLLLSALDGAMLSEYTTGGDAVARVAFDAIPEYVLTDLYVEQPPDLRSLAADVDLESMYGEARSEGEVADSE